MTAAAIAPIHSTPPASRKAACSVGCGGGAPGATAVGGSWEERFGAESSSSSSSQSSQLPAAGAGGGFAAGDVDLDADGAGPSSGAGAAAGGCGAGGSDAGRAAGLEAPHPILQRLVGPHTCRYRQQVSPSGHRHSPALNAEVDRQLGSRRRRALPADDTAPTHESRLKSIASRIQPRPGYLPARGRRLSGAAATHAGRRRRQGKEVFAT